MATVAPPAELDAAFPRTDPSQLFELAEGMHAVEVIVAAVGWLELFDRLDENRWDLAGVCEGLGIAARPADVMLTLCRALRLVESDDGGVFALSPLGREFMLSSSPMSLVPCYAALRERQPARDVLSVLRNDRPVEISEGPPSDDGEGEPEGQDWAGGMEEEQFAEFFLAALDSRNAYLAHALAETLELRGDERILDVGGGSGIYSCALAGRHGGVRATVLEKPPVDAVARRAIERRGLGDRVDVRTGDMLADALPLGYDAHLLSNVLHDWDPDTIRRLLGTCYRALPPGGRIVVHEPALDADKAGPLAIAQYSVLLMMYTQGRCYSVAEIQSFLEEAGFGGVSLAPGAVNRRVITATRPG
jgi:SAM-dependent methyltransferase